MLDTHAIFGEHGHSRVAHDLDGADLFASAGPLRVARVGRGAPGNEWDEQGETRFRGDGKSHATLVVEVVSVLRHPGVERRWLAVVPAAS
jgi:hypothetical protein